MNDAGTHLRGLNQGMTDTIDSGPMPQILCGPDSPRAGQPALALEQA